ncbi:thioredoxin family protein [Thermomonospora curvata]|uniref:Alkyl hydroperoxide reductase/ Thiol specific antioxidant/ Mal allergen n=1 Tax=Thermomonospora curvata (strain ATCC 19995 / DSM 43183 / JCM 3096 / KCTC 9072 / NBRC 15933 / NCIMB 10081 / Henssen B9) TaxID=471852 RepID=D1ABF4_THECD|nr:thioredoxin family protein [Thermomonospora curvata]ACY97190.1 alkyl hydroperoxide reductase/ Thiol specific antioxidant/ Mal allergen [Thermomonospora curvata DSM 43183]
MAIASFMVPLGTPAPDFTLPAITGGTVSLKDLSGAPAVLVMFLSNHCPYVRRIESALGSVVAGYRDKGLAAVAICSNDVTNYPDDGPDHLREQAERAGFTFPYLVDETQEVAKAYRAACTPDFFLYDRDLRLAYRGQFDGARPGNDVPADGSSLRAAIDLVLAGKTVPEPHVPSLGCGIKWKPGNEPA